MQDPLAHSFSKALVAQPPHFHFISSPSSMSTKSDQTKNRKSFHSNNACLAWHAGISRPPTSPQYRRMSGQMRCHQQQHSMCELATCGRCFSTEPCRPVDFAAPGADAAVPAARSLGNSMAGGSAWCSAARRQKKEAACGLDRGAILRDNAPLANELSPLVARRVHRCARCLCLCCGLTDLTMVELSWAKVDLMTQ